MEVLHKEPFEPFRIRLLDGSHYDITSPDLFAFLDEERRCFYASQDGHWAVFLTAGIVSLESLIAGEF